MDETKNNTVNNENEQAFSQLEGELKTRFELLPTELQQVITSSDYQTKLFEIAKKYKLTYDKLGQLELETTMVLLGMTPPDEFKLDISEQLKVDSTTLNNIVKDLNDQIFAPIRQQLMGIYSQEEVEIGEKFATNVTMTQENTVVDAKPTLDASLTKTTPSSQIATPQTPTKETTTPADSATPIKKVDPYRELPDVKPGSGVADPVEIKKEIPKGSIDTSFLKDIAPLSSTEKNIAPSASSFIDKTKDLGGLATMNNPIAQKKPLAPASNSGETLKKIQGLKDALLPDSAKAPIVQKEIIETAPKDVAGGIKNPFENTPAKTLVSTTLGASLKDNPLSYREPIETTPQPETIQKIDSLINMKKLEFFTDNKQTPQQPTSMSQTPTTATGASVAPVQNSIYDGEIASLKGQVSKTGFFAKMKNFFGGKKNNTETTPETTPIATPSIPVPPPVAPPKEIMAKGPIDDALVDSVKIFEE